MKKERGITLTILIITIIVLLILAGVSIAALGNSGLFSKSKDAVDKYNEAEKKEEEELSIYIEKRNKWKESSSKDQIKPGEMATENKKYEDIRGDVVVIPKDFKISIKKEEQIIEEGLVIADSVGNEWVWIPVKNEKYPIYEYNDIEKRNVGVLYSFSDNKPNALQYDAAGYRESDVGTYDGTTQDPIGITKEKMQKEFDEMIESIKIYEGFYIGRYDVGNSSQSKIVVKRGNGDIANQTWYSIYKKGREMYATNNSVQSSMIWGSQWDQAMIFMKDVKSIANKGKYFITDSTGMGNHSGVKITTGSNEAYKVKNIYDMAGNIWKWTMESNVAYHRVLRGGYWAFGGDVYSASYRNQNIPINLYSHYGARLQMYVK